MPFEPVIGEDARVELIQGSTHQETWSFDDGGTPHDFTGETLEWRFARDASSPPWLILTSEGMVDPLTDGDGLYIDGTTFLLYITDETLAGLDEDDATKFRRSGSCDDDTPFHALNTLLLTNADDETEVVASGPVAFTPVVQPA